MLGSKILNKVIANYVETTNQNAVLFMTTRMREKNRIIIHHVYSTLVDLIRIVLFSIRHVNNTEKASLNITAHVSKFYIYIFIQLTLYGKRLFRSSSQAIFRMLLAARFTDSYFKHSLRLSLTRGTVHC